MNYNGNKYQSTKFVDISDYTRLLANFVARRIQSTSIKPWQINILHFLVMLFAVWLIYKQQIIVGCILILVKNFLDALDGSLARVRGEQNNLGALLDSNLDFVGNLFLFAVLPQLNIFNKVVSFLFFLIQSTIFQRYYRLLRYDIAKVQAQDSQGKLERILKFFYSIFYGWQDKLVMFFEQNYFNFSKIRDKNKFVSLLSINGTGFQHLVIIVFLLLNISFFVSLYFVVFTSFYIILVFLYNFSFKVKKL